MAKQPPERRRDSMNVLSSRGAHGASSPQSAVLPHHHQPVMVGHAPTAPVNVVRRRFTLEEMQILQQRRAMMASQSPQGVGQPSQFQYIPVPATLNGQNGNMPVHLYMDPSLSIQTPRLFSSPPNAFPPLPQGLPVLPVVTFGMNNQTQTFIDQTVPLPSNGSPYSSPKVPVQYQNMDRRQRGAQNMQGAAPASPSGLRWQLGHGLANNTAVQSNQSVSLDPQQLQYTSPRPDASLMPPPATNQPSVRVPPPIPRPSPASVPPQYAGQKRPAPRQDTSTEGPPPKRGMFATAVPTSRPSSSQGMNINPVPSHNPHPNPQPLGRMTKQAMKRGVQNLDIPKKRFRVDAVQGELQKPGHATAATPSYSRAMIEMKKNAIAQEVDIQAWMNQKGSSRKRQAAPLQTLPPGAKASNFIDLTGPEDRKRKATVDENRDTQAKRQKTDTTQDSQRSVAPTARDFRHHALRRGVRMSDVEYGYNIRASMCGWLFHQGDLAQRRSLLDPPLAVLQRLRAASQAINHNQTNTMDAAHAKALRLPVPFDMQTVRAKVRHPSYDYGYSDHNGGMSEQQNKDAREVCQRDEDGMLRAPEEEHMSEERAVFLYQLSHLAAERGVFLDIPREITEVMS